MYSNILSRFRRLLVAAICLIVLMASPVPIVWAESGPEVEGSQLFQKLPSDLQERLAKAPLAEKEEAARALLSKPQGGQPSKQFIFTRTATFGGIHDSVAVRDPWVYSASGYQLNIFLQAGGPQDLTLYSQMDLRETVWDIAISEDGRLVILASGVGVYFVDISNPSFPIEEGFYPSRGFADSVAVLDSHTVAVSDGIELLVLDFANPARPILVSSYDTGGWLRFVRTRGNTIYAISGGEGLYILDFNYQRGVRLQGFHAIPSWVYSVAVKQQRGDGRLIAVTTWEHGIATIDVTIPTEPTLLGTCPNLGSAKDVVVYGDVAYVADEMRGLLAINICDPSQPLIVSNRDTANALAVAVDSRGYVYIADATGVLGFVQAASTGEIFKVGSYDFPGFPRSLEKYLGHFFVAGWSTGLHIATRDWYQLWYQPTSQGATAVAFSGQYAFVVNYDGDLEVLTSGYRGYLATPGQASDIVISGRYAYVADGSEGGLRIYDISSPMDIHEASSLKLSGNVWGVIVAGNFAYVADGGAGTEIVDVTDHAHPKLVGNIPTSSWTHEVALSWPYLYGADGYDGVHIWDVSIPNLPRFVGAYPFNYAEVIAVRDGYAFVGETDGLRVLDVRNPAQPISAGFYWIGRSVSDVKVEGDQIYLVGDFGVITLQYKIISTPHHVALPALMR